MPDIVSNEVQLLNMYKKFVFLANVHELPRVILLKDVHPLNISRALVTFPVFIDVIDRLVNDVQSWNK